ncbi:MAG: DUF5610 domain-containing protein [bacterium]|jgi:hypothetical protein|nr:DUF5610 domain-containing protein [bacterium]
MADPIQAVSMARIETHPYPEHYKTPVHPPAPVPLSAKSEHDSLSISFNLYGDLNQLRESVAAIHEKLKSQLEAYFGITSATDEQKAALEQPENASAKQLLEFFSPANTAKRIANFATGFMGQFQANNPTLSGEDQINQFTSLIQSAIKKGFDEAETVLGDFTSLGIIGQAIQETYHIVLSNIEEFRTEFLKKLNPSAKDEEEEKTGLDEAAIQNESSPDTEGSSPEQEPVLETEP